MNSIQRVRNEWLTITEVSTLTGLSAHTLRYYERTGLVGPVSRSRGNQRRYAADDLGWMIFLLHLRDTGMSITAMKRFAELRRSGEGSLRARLELLLEHRAELTERIHFLQVNGQALDDKITRYRELLGQHETADSMSS